MPRFTSRLQHCACHSFRLQLLLADYLAPCLQQPQLCLALVLSMQHKTCRVFAAPFAGCTTLPSSRVCLLVASTFLVLITYPLKNLSCMISAAFVAGICCFHPILCTCSALHGASRILLPLESVQIYVSVFINIYTCVYVHVYIVYICVLVYMCTFKSSYTCIYIHIYTHKYIYIHACVHIYLCTNTYIHTICECIYLHIYIYAICVDIETTA